MGCLSTEPTTCEGAGVLPRAAFQSARSFSSVSLCSALGPAQEALLLWAGFSHIHPRCQASLELPGGL